MLMMLAPVWQLRVMMLVRVSNGAHQHIVSATYERHEASMNLLGLLRPEVDRDVMVR